MYDVVYDVIVYVVIVIVRVIIELNGVELKKVTLLLFDTNWGRREGGRGIKTYPFTCTTYVGVGV